MHWKSPPLILLLQGHQVPSSCLNPPPLPPKSSGTPRCPSPHSQSRPSASHMQAKHSHSHPVSPWTRSNHLLIVILLLADCLMIALLLSEPCKYYKTVKVNSCYMHNAWYCFDSTLKTRHASAGVVANACRFDLCDLWFSPFCRLTVATTHIEDMQHRKAGEMYTSTAKRMA